MHTSQTNISTGINILKNAILFICTFLMPLFYSSYFVNLEISSFHLKYSLKRIAAYLKSHMKIHCANYLVKVFLFLTNNFVICHKKEIIIYCFSRIVHTRARARAYTYAHIHARTHIIAVTVITFYY